MAKKVTKAKTKKSGSGNKAGNKGRDDEGAATTIRIIESRRPCVDQYYAFLLDFNGWPIDTRHYPDFPRVRNPKAPSIGPDAPIPLSAILGLKSQHGGMGGGDRVSWLIEHKCVQEEYKVLIETLEGMDDFGKFVIKLDLATVKKLLA